MATLPNWPVQWERLFAPLLDKWAAVYGLPRDLVYGLVAQESSFNSGAYRAEPRLNDASYGLTQILFATARDPMGYTGTIAGLFDPDTNLALGLGYLKRMVTKFGRTRGLAAYNGGLIGGVIRNQPYVDGVEAKAAYFRNLWGTSVTGTTGQLPPPGTTYPSPPTNVTAQASIPAWLVLGMLTAGLVVRRKPKGGQ